MPITNQSNDENKLWQENVAPAPNQEPLLTMTMPNGPRINFKRVTNTKQLIELFQQSNLDPADLGAFCTQVLKMHMPAQAMESEQRAKIVAFFTHRES